MGLLSSISRRLDHRYGWDHLPRPLGILTLIGIRQRLRKKNLYDTGTGVPVQPADGDRHLTARTIDGSYNDLSNPAMGAIGARFGRNVPVDRTWPETEPGILEPNPRRVSRELLTREKFIPATTLNVIAGAWLQFEVHDWFSHGTNEPENPWEIDLAQDDDWWQRPMRIARTRRDPTDTDDSGPPTFVTADSHWWDGSQIYGSERGFADAIRANEGGRLRVDELGLLPKDLEKHVDIEGVAANFWLGLGVLHTLFTLEHNAIADRLRSAHPSWSDDKLFDTTRLVNSALMAKIHTVEWTPGIIAHPTTQLAMNANWWGLLGERFRRKVGRLGRGEVLSGIPGSPTNHHGVPYSLTEEFVAVYRMHPLLPDDYVLRSHENDAVLEERTFPQVALRGTREVLEKYGMASCLYSLGREHPGAITLHNYPRFLQSLERPDGTTVDLAATDILRVRERGVPRYNDFRRLFHRKPVSSFEELNPQHAEELRRLYGDVERLDLMIGLYSEPLPKGFGFSDTAFRVFVLMASRRLKSDRFLTTDYGPKLYTQEGIDWINETTMKTVLLRHFPQLEPALRGISNAFVPWTQVAR
jgi:hypothetical protein